MKCEYSNIRIFVDIPSRYYSKIDHFGSSNDPCYIQNHAVTCYIQNHAVMSYIQNHAVTSRVIKRLKCVFIKTSPKLEKSSMDWYLHAVITSIVLSVSVISGLYVLSDVL